MIRIVDPIIPKRTGRALLMLASVGSAQWERIPNVEHFN